MVATNTVKATKRNPPPGEEGQAHEAAHQNGQDRWCQEVQLQARIKAQEHAPATRKRFLIAGSATLELVLITPQNLVCMVDPRCCSTVLHQPLIETDDVKWRLAGQSATTVLNCAAQADIVRAFGLCRVVR